MGVALSEFIIATRSFRFLICVREQWTVGVKVSEYICLLEGFQWKFAKTLGTQNARDDVLSWCGWPGRIVL